MDCKKLINNVMALKSYTLFVTWSLGQNEISYFSTRLVQLKNDSRGCLIEK